MGKLKFLTILFASFSMALVGCNKGSNNNEDDTIHVSGVTLDYSSLNLFVGDTSTLVASVLPAEASDKTVSWSSSLESVASVDNGVVTANSEGQADITVTTLDGSFSDVCRVYVKEQIRTIKGYIHDEKSLLNGNPFMKVDDEYIEVNEKGTEDDVLYYVFNYDSDLKFSLIDKDNIIPLGLEVDGVKYDIDANGDVYFKAHVEDEDDFFLSITVLYKDESVVGGDYTFDIHNSDHISLEMYASNKTQKISGANQEDIVYIKPIISESDYEVQRIIYSYSTSDIGSKYTLETTKEGDLYRFKVPFAYDKIIHIFVSEINKNLLKDYELAGNYLVIDRSLFTSNHVYNEFQDNILTIETSGKITFGNYLNQLSEATAKSGEGKAIDSEHSNEFLYDTNFFLAKAMNGSYLSSPLKGYHDILGVKMIEGSKASDYSLAAELIVLDKTYFIATTFYKGSLYASTLIDYTSNIVYFNVDLKMYLGDRITDQKAMYDIFDEDTKIIGISYQNGGGIFERIALDERCGVFSGDNGGLIVPNEASAVYEGNPYVLVINETTFTLSNADYVITFKVNYEDMTYQVISIEENTSSIPSFKNLTFTGTIYNSWEDANITIQIVFDDYQGDDISGVLKHDATSIIHHWFYFTATYDLSSNVLSMTFYQENYHEGSIGKICYAACAEGKMTITNNFIPNNSAYDVKGCILSCSDFHL